MKKMRLKSVILYFIIILHINWLKGDGYKVIHNPIRFPYGGPYMGLFLALAVPLEIPNYNVFVSYNLEANYNLPQNETEYYYPPLVTKRSVIDRQLIYTALENKITMYGYPGKKCLLRIICEAAKHSLENNGVLEDILHVVLTPSSSTSSKENPEYMKAEEYGNKKGHCKKYSKQCSVNLLNTLSILQ